MEFEELRKIIEERDTYRGLSSDEAKRRLREYGPNQRPGKKPDGWLKRLWGIVSEPMMLLLIATAVVYFFVGTPLETIILSISLVPIVLMEFVQEKKTDQAIRVLDTMLREECAVFRDQKLVKMDNKELVPGDLVYLTAGDKIPADGYFIRSPGALVDEAILTGESSPVAKGVVSKIAQEISEEYKVFQGTLLVQGEGYLAVTATGSKTSYGQLGSLIEHIVAVETPLQKKINRLVKVLAILAVITAAAIGMFLALEKGLVPGLLGALTLAIAIIPEEFPIVFSVFLVMGVWRMSKRNALVREMAMVETLGSATIICTDKTGTLTRGTMELKKVWRDGSMYDVESSDPGVLKPLIADAILALEQVAVDPIEVEVQRVAERFGMVPKNFFAAHELVKDSSFDSVTKTVSHIWRAQGKSYQYTAGAPESVLAMCAIDETSRRQIQQVYDSMAKDGYRMIAIAKATAGDGHSFDTKTLVFGGLLFMSDPPRPEAAEAIRLCQSAGIRVLMITGDNPLTAASIAREIGLPQEGSVITGKDLENATPAKLASIVSQHSIYARVRPEQKYALVEALQNKGEIVAMTGDGVNDAPALKKAHIGIAMGKKGTEVARAASGIVLMDDNFATIVKAVEEGRRIYDNLRQAFIFLFSFHIPIIGLSFLPLFMGRDLFFLPIHIIFLEFFGDPASVIGFEREPARAGIMTSPPRPVREPLINRPLWWRVALQGGGITAVSFGLYYFFGIEGGDIQTGRTAAFLALVVSQIALIYFTREWHQVRGNRLLLGISLGMVVVTHLAVFAPGFKELFHFVPLILSQYVLVIGASLLSMGVIALITRGMKTHA